MIGLTVILIPVPAVTATEVTVPVLVVYPLGFVAAYAPISDRDQATLKEPLTDLPVFPIVNVLAFCQVVDVSALPTRLPRKFSAWISANAKVGCAVSINAKSSGSGVYPLNTLK